MANTLVLLERITVGAAGAASVTFNSIPQTGYTDLVLKASARTTRGTTYDWVKLTFNGSTTAAYSDRILLGSGAAASSSSDSAIAAIQAGLTNADSATASSFGNLEYYIPNYTSANYKSVSVDTVNETNGTTAYSSLVAGLWSNTAAITSITFTPDSGGASYMQYSTFSLYGVSAVGTTPTKAPKALGGSIIETDGTYWYHAFLSSGTFTPAIGLSCDVLVVAGGGGSPTPASTYLSGGGGAGGFQVFTSQVLTTTSYSCTIGAGGTSSPTNGTNSQFGSLTASVGGGAGAGKFSNASSGGGGGGGAGTNSATATGGAGTSGQGYSGGNGADGGGTGYRGGGGGGSIGNLGGSSTGAGTGGAGAVGTSSYSSWGLATATGQNVSSTYYYAGGGGGYGDAGNGAGGYGGGGSNSAGTANTGGGGSINAGGSGIVIVRYLA